MVQPKLKGQTNVRSRIVDFPCDYVCESNGVCQNDRPTRLLTDLISGGKLL